MNDEQLSLFSDNPEYDAFVDKFKPKKTTDDCFTPENVYQVVADWVAEEYGVDPTTFVRPFWPGKDYQAFDYKRDCIVVDNPPFSILSRICSWYCDHGIRFFLFAPSLTCLSGNKEKRYGAVIADANITYENGAVVRTAFVQNLDGGNVILRTAPSLHRRLEAINKSKAANLPKYIYPYHVVTAAMAQRYCHYEVEYAVRREDCMIVSKLDAQKAQGKTIFGSGLLLSERAAAERAAAERAAAERAAAERAAAERAAAERAAAIEWRLSERERDLILSLRCEEDKP